MARIEDIKQKILQLDAGSFQSLCDVYLSKIGYKGIVSLGSEAGTRKTTKGTPDTYFCTLDGQYVFVEYTTQKTNLITKIKEDIQKCLDVSKTNIALNKISEIIYCHTSSNITPSQDNDIKSTCKNVGIKLTIIGIDQIAEDLFLRHHGITKEFLEIGLSTDQIQLYDDFVKQYNANKLAAPIDTKFLFREQDIEKIDKAFEEKKIVILNGPAGAGKTRLALQYAQIHSERYQEELFCIHNNALPIYEDLKVFIEKSKSYFILIDDANQLSGLQHVVRYTTMIPEGYHVKILITVRDYAVQKVENDIRQIASYELININRFSDKEIEGLLKELLGILNSQYLDRIIRIAEGNARIAMLAGKVACNSNRLDSISDVSGLYEDYYGTIFQDNYLHNDNGLLITACLIAFLESIHLDYIDSLSPILRENGINRQEFIENVYKLHIKEIVNIYNDKAVRVSEQCFSNYLLKYVFFDKKILSLSLMITLCFPTYREKVVFSINTLLHIFRNEPLYNFVSSEIKKVWDELSKAQSPFYFEFVKCFFYVNPTETLLILQDKIKQKQSVKMETSKIDTETRKNDQRITDEIIEVLGGFANSDDLSTALDLFLGYYLKRPDLYMQFYHAILNYFGIQRYSANYNYKMQIILFEKLKEYSNEWKQESMAVLFLDISKEFLKFQFHPSEGIKNYEFRMYNIPLIMSEGVEKYRKSIWEYLIQLSKIDKFESRVREVLNSYGGPIERISIPVLQFDSIYIQLIMETSFPPTELQNCLLANRIKRVFMRINPPCESLFSNYFQGEKFFLYNILKGPAYKTGVKFEESRQLKQQNIEQYVSDCNLIKFKKLIDICAEINILDEHASHEIVAGLGIAFEALIRKNSYYVNTVEYYIKKDTPNNLDSCQFVKNLFALLDDSDVYDLINKFEYKQKNSWIYAYFHELPQPFINQKNIQRLYKFLKDPSDKDIVSSTNRDVDFLEKYHVIDPKCFEKGCATILLKMDYSPFIGCIYFSLLFNPYHNTPQELAQKFSDNLNLLEDIYFALLKYDIHHDYDGDFLREIYSVNSSVLDKYVNYLFNESKDSYYDYGERLRCFFELESFKEIYDQIFERFIQNYQHSFFVIPYFLESLLIVEHDKLELLGRQKEWVQHCIKMFSKDIIKMQCLFSIISKLGTDEKIYYISLFLEFNQLPEDFEQLPLTPTHYSWNGSLVPMYSAWCSDLESLLPQFIGLKWLRHKKRVEVEINILKKTIETEQINEILKGEIICR